MRIGKSVWVSSRKNVGNNTRPIYDEPFVIKTRPNYFTVMPAIARGYAEFTKYGELANDIWTVIANSNVFSGVFKVGDLMWVDGASPQKDIEEDCGIGASANAKVVGVYEVNHTISITLQRKQ